MHRQSCTAPISHLSIAISLLLLLLTTPPLQAAEIKGLYEAEVPVVGQGAEQRRAAIHEAFRKVVVKVSGRREILSDKELHKTQRKAAQYVQQYRYRMTKQPLTAAKPKAVTKRDPETEAAVTPEASTEQQWRLWVNFDATAINRLLREKGLPVWGATRPAVVIWLSQERQGERLMLQPEMLPKTVAAINERAEQRGLSIVLPMMDMEDHNSLPVNALWGSFSEIILQASARYEADVAVTGRLVATDANRWRVEWSLYQDEGVEQWIGAEGRVSEVVAYGVEQLGDRLAKRYAQATAGNSLSQLQVVVTEINDLAGYDKVKNYFESLEMVKWVVLQAMDINSGEFLLNVRGGEAALNQGVKLGTVLEQITSEPIKESEESAGEPEPVEGPPLPESLEHIRPTFRLR